MVKQRKNCVLCEVGRFDALKYIKVPKSILRRVRRRVGFGTRRKRA